MPAVPPPQYCRTDTGTGPRGRGVFTRPDVARRRERDRRPRAGSQRRLIGVKADRETSAVSRHAAKLAKLPHGIIREVSLRRVTSLHGMGRAESGVGQRAYYATRFLAQHGYRARNLSGGFATYRAFQAASVLP